MKKIILGLVLLSILILSGCSSKIEYIGNFIAITDEKAIELRFSLYDDSKKFISADGSGIVKIEDSEENVLYTGVINIRKENFGVYTRVLTGEFIEAYVWEIPLSEIRKSVSSSGTIYLTFGTKDAQFKEITTDVWNLPSNNEDEFFNIINNLFINDTKIKYDREELIKLNEQEFLKNSIEINKKISKGNFEISVQKVGFFNLLTFLDESEEYFRINMEVKNIGNQKEYFLPSALAILDNQGNQFEIEYGGTLDTFIEIYPNVKKKGYILFKNISKNSQTIKFVFELDFDENYNAHFYEYKIILP